MAEEPIFIDRYAIFDEIASGGMATVHVGRFLGPVGFSRTVAVKRLHPQFAKNAEFVSMFVDEARVAARVSHPNVVPTIDVVRAEGELFLVMEYVEGESFSRLLRRARRHGQALDIRIVAAIVVGVLHGLHAAHTARGEGGEPLHIVHRDVSPENVLVGVDGVPRVFDFGVAKARGRLQVTRQGQIKGKLAYMAPEQLSGEEVSPASDIYAVAIVLWEALANRRLFRADTEAALVARVLEGPPGPPSTHNPSVSPELDELVLRGLSKSPKDRFASAREMAGQLEQIMSLASATEIGAWVESYAAETLQPRAERIAEIESHSDVDSLRERSSRSTLESQESIAANQEEGTGVTRRIDTDSELLLVPTRRKWWPVALALLVLAVLPVFVGWSLLDADEPPALGGEAVPTTTLGEDSSSQEAPPLEASAEEPAEPSEAEASSSAAVEASAAPVAAPPRPVAPRPRVQPPPAAPPPPPPPKAAQCNPPYFFDSEGIKKYKPACL